MLRMTLPCDPLPSDGDSRLWQRPAERKVQFSPQVRVADAGDSDLRRAIQLSLQERTSSAGSSASSSGSEAAASAGITREEEDIAK